MDKQFCRAVQTEWLYWLGLVDGAHLQNMDYELARQRMLLLKWRDLFTEKNALLTKGFWDTCRHAKIVLPAIGFGYHKSLSIAPLIFPNFTDLVTRMVDSLVTLDTRIRSIIQVFLFFFGAVHSYTHTLIHTHTHTHTHSYTHTHTGTPEPGLYGEERRAAQTDRLVPWTQERRLVRTGVPVHPRLGRLGLQHASGGNTTWQRQSSLGAVLQGALPLHLQGNRQKARRRAHLAKQVRAATRGNHHSRL